jgi:excinuclease ABC subunit A
MDAKDHSFVFVKGARENNLKNISVKIPRDAIVVFTGVSGSGKSSLAFGTIYAEAQRRYLESVSPYARRLFNQLPVPEVDDISGLPPAVALQQQRGTPSTRSTVGSITTLSNSLRMLYSRAGDYPRGQEIIYAEAFSPNTPAGACPHCQGLGRIYDATEESMVPDTSLSIHERAIAAWPSAWHGQNLREMLVTLGFDVNRPWKKLSKQDRDWILFTEERPEVPVYSGFNAKEVKAAIKAGMEPSYHGNFSGVRRYLLDTFATTQSELMKKRVAKFLISALCPKCQGKRLRAESLAVKFENRDIAEISALPLKILRQLLLPYATGQAQRMQALDATHPEQVLAAKLITQDIIERINVLTDLGLGYLSLERTTPTLSPGELQRLRLATQVRSNLFGVVYVLDEPSAGLHPSDTEALLQAFEKLKQSGNSIFVVEHEIDVIKRADWIVDVGPAAGEGGGEIIYSGPRPGLARVKNSLTAKYLFGARNNIKTDYRHPRDQLRLRELNRNNVRDLDLNIPLGVMSCFTGISGSGKSTIVSQLLVEILSRELGQGPALSNQQDYPDLGQSESGTYGGRIVGGATGIKKLVVVDQRPIGRTPRSNLATYTGLFDHVRRLFAATRLARSRKYDPGRFSFNLDKGRCSHCQGEGLVMVELLFLPSAYSPCPECHGSRFNSKTLEIKYQDKSIAEVLNLNVTEAHEFFQHHSSIARSLETLLEVGLGYLKLGQPATELSGGEAQRIKLATELQKITKGDSIYVLDEPTTGLHPSDVDNLILQLEKLVDAGNTVILVEHDMQVISNADWVIDVGPGAGDEGGQVVTSGTPRELARSNKGKTSQYLQRFLGNSI